MRAKRNGKIKLLMCVIMAALLCAALVACNKYKPDHYDHLVTFDYNLGTKIVGNAEPLYVGVLDPDKNGSLVGIRPGYNDTNFNEATIKGYYIEGWYEAKEYDADGEPVRDTADGRVILGEKFDFATHRIKDDITLYANLVLSPRMRFIDSDTGEQVGEIDGKKPGERRARPSGALSPSKNVDGQPYTFMGDYFADRECTRLFEFPYVFGDEDVDVYCKFIEGSWALVSAARELITAVGNGSNIYLMDDIDMTGQAFGGGTYNGELNGNGHSIKNLAISRTDRNAINRRTTVDLGIFGKLLARAYVHDVNFENITIDIETSSDYGSITGVNIGLLAGVADGGARIENVFLSGVITCNNYTLLNVNGLGGIVVSPFIAQNNTSKDNIVNCDYSGVKLIYLS